MAYYFLFPEIDATIYSHPDRLEMNTGHDEILEIVKEKGSSDERYYPSRVLIKFKTEDLKSAIETQSVTCSSKSALNIASINPLPDPEIFFSSIYLFSVDANN